MRRVAALASALTVPLLTAPAALAGAGGGSSGFGGGGGGGGGGGFGGGGGSYGGGGTGGGFFSGVVLVIFLIVVAAVVVAGWIAGLRLRRRRREREHKVELASAEAASDDPAFAADAVIPAAGRLYVECQLAWDARDRAKLEQLVGGDLLVEWKRRLDDFDAKHWHNRVAVHGTPHVEYMGLVNREGEGEDRVVVRIEASQDDYVEQTGGRLVLKDGATSKLVSVTEWWTLARRDHTWIVVSIETDTEGVHHLDDAIVAVPEADDERLRDASTVEVAQDDAAPAGTKTAEIADLDFAGDARAAAMDLSLADARFAPDVLEVAVRRAVAGWAEAIDGEDAPLLAVAAPAVAKELLYPNDPAGHTRLVVRGPVVRRMHIAKLDAAADPAKMDVDVTVSGRRYRENRDTAAVVSGSKDHETTFTERWTLAIDGPAANPWRIVGARDR